MMPIVSPVPAPRVQLNKEIEEERPAAASSITQAMPLVVEVDSPVLRFDDRQNAGAAPSSGGGPDSYEGATTVEEDDDANDIAAAQQQQEKVKKEEEEGGAAQEGQEGEGYFDDPDNSISQSTFDILMYAFSSDGMGDNSALLGEVPVMGDFLADAGIFFGEEDDNARDGYGCGDDTASAGLLPTSEKQGQGLAYIENGNSNSSSTSSNSNGSNGSVSQFFV
jgi:hypothetical protein